MLENGKEVGDKNRITRGRYCKIYHFCPSKIVGHVEVMKNQRTPKRIVTATMEETRKIVRARERWRVEVEEDLSTVGITKQARNDQSPLGI